MGQHPPQQITHQELESGINEGETSANLSDEGYVIPE